VDEDVRLAERFGSRLDQPERDGGRSHTEVRPHDATLPGASGQKRRRSALAPRRNSYRTPPSAGHVDSQGDAVKGSRTRARYQSTWRIRRSEMTAAASTYGDRSPSALPLQPPSVEPSAKPNESVASCMPLASLRFSSAEPAVL